MRPRRSDGTPAARREIPVAADARGPDSIFRAEGDHWRPTELARGPWDPEALHGGAPAALLARALERVTPGDGLALTRLTYEFRRPVPFAPLSLEASVVRAGRRVQELRGELRAGDRSVCSVHALSMRPASVDSFAEQEPAPGPDEGRPVVFSLDGAATTSFAANAMEMRWLRGEDEPGPSFVWMRLRHPLVPGEPLTPVVRAVAAADFGNGVSAVLSWREHVFINADLTVYLHRPPQGEWIGLDSRTHLQAGGAGTAVSVLHDTQGPVGHALQALIVQPR